MPLFIRFGDFILRISEITAVTMHAETGDAEAHICSGASREVFRTGIPFEHFIAELDRSQCASEFSFINWRVASVIFVADAAPEEASR